MTYHHHLNHPTSQRKAETKPPMQRQNPAPMSARVPPRHPQHSACSPPLAHLLSHAVSMGRPMNDLYPYFTHYEVLYLYQTLVNTNLSTLTRTSFDAVHRRTLAHSLLDAAGHCHTHRALRRMLAHSSCIPADTGGHIAHAASHWQTHPVLRQTLADSSLTSNTYSTQQLCGIKGIQIRGVRDAPAGIQRDRYLECRCTAVGAESGWMQRRKLGIKVKEGKESARKASSPMWGLPEPRMPIRRTDGVVDGVSALAGAGCITGIPATGVPTGTC